MHDLLIHAMVTMGRVLCVLVACACLGWNEELLDGIHESSKDQSSEHDKHESRRHYKLIVLLAVAFRACFFILSIPLDLEHEREGNRTTDHTSVRDKNELFKLNGLLLEAAPA